MSVLNHRFVETNGIRMHVAEAGEGPLVLLCHGFPESWYSWRHQIRCLADAGYHVVAPDQRGYGQTDAPPDFRSYTLLHLVGDLVGLLDAIGERAAVVVGHDWGAPVAWHAALLRPDRFRAVAGMSVPGASHHAPGRPTDLMRAAVNGAFLYILYFQEEGVAEAELDRDIRGTLRRFLYSISGDIPRDDFRFFNWDAKCLNDCLREPPSLPAWLTEVDLDVFTAEFERKGTFRHAINWYRCIDLNSELLAPFAGLRVEQPALFIGAEYDAILGQTREGVAATKDWVPNLRDPVWIENCGHWLQQEEPEQVNAALLRFLRDLR
ncbi:MAG: alpha/beta hydrolase [Deltaproteobacteria bacterium]|nr:alpha/beta hydrolase [Deltaproteobacteria bacterium]